MTMGNQLSGHGASGGESCTVDDVIKARLKKLKKTNTGVGRRLGGFFIVTAELFFENTIKTLGFLLLTKLFAEVRSSSAELFAVLTRSLEAFFLNGTFGRIAKLHSFAATESVFWSGISCHMFLF